MKILLINPPSPGDYPFTREGRCMQREGVWTTVWPPLSLCTIGAVLRDAGLGVKIHDCPSENIDRQGLAGILKEYVPDLLFISTSTPSIKYDVQIPSLAKKILPELKVAAFGIHVGVLPDETFALAPDLDFILRGEPEFTALELAQNLKKGDNLNSIPGLSFSHNGTLFHNPGRPFYAQLDELPFPAWDLVNLDNYTLPFSGRRFVMVMSSRGCPFDCTFCVAQSYYGKKLRQRSSGRIVDEIEYIMKNLKISDFFFWSESFTIIKRNIHELCDEISGRGLKIRWVCNSRVDNVDAELLIKMKRAGCWMISYGLESGDQEILDRALKKVKLEEVERAVALTRKIGFQIAGHFVLGLPGENEETLQKTAKLAKKLDLDYAQFYCAAPWPGSRLYDLAKKEGWLNTDDWNRYEQSQSVLDYPQISARRIMERRDRMVRDFYLRPKIIWKTLKKISSTKEMINFLKMVRSYLTWS